MGTFFGWYQIEFVGDNVLQACRTLVALKLIHELNAMKAVFELLALTMASMVSYLISHRFSLFIKKKNIDILYIDALA